uniref:Uncharacterized protein n=1 Tax=Acrobeloides nanus TaxID=290746 RepID=A0A914E1V2_9BILA
MQNPTDQGKRNNWFKTWDGSIWSIRRTARTSPQAISTYFLEHWLRGKKFRTIEEMRQSLTEFFDSKDRDWYRRGIAKLEEQWQKVIESGGEYFDY